MAFRRVLVRSAGTRQIGRNCPSPQKSAGRSGRIGCTACRIENAEILMISRNGSSAVKADQAEAPVSQAVEAMHMAGSAVVTGGVAAVLIVVAIPVSLGLGIAWGARSIGKKFSRKIGRAQV